MKGSLPHLQWKEETAQPVLPGGIPENQAAAGKNS
jgi:hypothetical protein